MTELFLSTLGSFTAWLLRTSWQASALIGLVLLAQWLLRKHLSPGWRYGLWLLVLIRLMLPAAPPSPFSVFNFSIGSLADVFGAERTGSQARWLAVEQVVSTPASSVVDSRSATSAQPRTVSQAGHEGQGKAKAFSKSGGAGVPRKEAGRTSQSAVPGPVALALAWLAGALLLVARVVWIPVRLNARLARQHSAVNLAVLEILEESQQCLGVRKVLPIVQSAAVDSPALMGFIRPWLLLPEGMAGRFTPQELRFVFLHELAHLKRRDIAVNWLMTLLQVLHWFNPLVWFAFSRMRADRELACDALALSRAGEGEKEAYGETIIKLLESFTRPAPMAGLVGILEDKQQMKRRIGMIAKFGNASPGSSLALVVLLALGLVSLTDAQTDKPENLEKISVARTSAELTLRRLPDFHKDLRFYPYDISPDGRYLLGDIVPGDRGEKSAPMVIDQISGAERRYDVVDDRPGTASALKFSPDSKQILCARLWERGSNYTKELLLLDTETGKMRRIYRNEDIATIWCQDWSSDGQSILATFEKMRDGRREREIALISISEGSAREIKTSDISASIGTCAFSPDARWIVCTAWEAKSRTSDIHLVASDGSSDIVLAQHPADDRLLGWPPSSEQIIFVSDRRGSWDAYSLQVIDGKPIGEPVLLREIGQGIRPLRFTRNGAFFYSKGTSTRDVYFADIDPASGKVIGKPRKAARIEGRNQYPAWSRDGRFLAYTSSDSQDGVIGIRDMENGTVREINSDISRFSFPQWSPDGGSIFALSYAAGKSLAYRINAESGLPTVVTNGVRLIYNEWPLWSWSPDGKSFYQRARGEAFKHFDVETGNIKEIQIPGSGGSTVFSPNCQQLVCSVTKRNEAGTVTRRISVLPISGGESRLLVELFGPEAVEEIQLLRSLDDALCWTPDGRHVVFVKGNTNNQSLRSLWRVPVAGGEPEDLGLEMEKLRHPTISPDGRRIAFTAGGSKSELWVMENFLPAQKTAAK